MKILVTGFEPFGGETENASGVAVDILREFAPSDGVCIATASLPVTWSGAGPALLRAVEEHRPDAVVAVGEAGGRTAVTPERWARNLGHGRIPDNDGGVRDAAPLCSAYDYTRPDDCRAVSGRPERPAGGSSGKSGSVFFCTRKNSSSGATTGRRPSSA